MLGPSTRLEATRDEAAVAAVKAASGRGVTEQDSRHL